MRARGFVARGVTLMLLVCGLACGGSETAPQPSISGTWSGTTAGKQVLTISLTDQAGAVSGSGTLSNTPTGTRALTVSGSFSAPTVQLTFSSGTLPPFNFQATVSGPTMHGFLNGSGFNNDTLTLVRFQ